MATKLEGDAKIKRLVRIHGIGEIEIGLSVDGLTFRAPGTKISTTLSLGEAVSKSHTPGNVPSYHYAKPVEFLAAQVKKVEASRGERERNKGKHGGLC